MELLHTTSSRIILAALRAGLLREKPVNADWLKAYYKIFQKFNQKVTKGQKLSDGEFLKFVEVDCQLRKIL